MKFILLVLLLSSISASAQRFLLADPKGKRPVILSESIHADTTEHFYLPVSAEGKDTFMAHLWYIGELLIKKKEPPADSFMLVSGRTVFSVKHITKGYQPNYHIEMETRDSNSAVRSLVCDGNSVLRANFIAFSRLQRYFEKDPHFRIPYRHIIVQPILY